MPQFSSFALQFTNFTAASLSATGAELLIVESGVTTALGQPTLTAAELATLGAQGRLVLGYVNTSVTDANREYWNPAWVTPTNPDEPDIGVISATAPPWLRNNFGTIDFAPEPPGAPSAPEAVLVDYRDPAWRALVVAQAVEVVQAGFHGVFLDDVARYFQAGYAGDGYDPTLADSMMALVLEVATAIRAVNPDATLIINSGVYISFDSTGGLLDPLYVAYRSAIDGVLIENQFITESDPIASHVLSDASGLFPGVDILPLENRASGVNVEAFLAFAGSMGMVPYISPDETYGQAAPAVWMGTSGGDSVLGALTVEHIMAGLAGADTLRGGRLDDEIYGHAGNDSLSGIDGNDLLVGGAGLDIAKGGNGHESLYGGDNADVLHGNLGDDLLYGGTGNDVILGHGGDNQLFGGLGNDTLNGGANRETMDGGDGQDSLFASSGNDFVFGGNGQDTLIGDFGDDWLYGGNGGDSLYGGIGNDYVSGGADSDRIYGGVGDDTLLSGAGHDMLLGGAGANVFVFAGNVGIDRIGSFNRALDRLDFSAFGTNLAAVQAAIVVKSWGLEINLASLGGTGAVQFVGTGATLPFAADDFIF